MMTKYRVFLMINFNFLAEDKAEHKMIFMLLRLSFFHFIYNNKTGQNGEFFPVSTCLGIVFMSVD